jgi:hypothetical protein
LAGSPGFVHDAFDAVVDDKRAVVAGRAAPNQDAAISGSTNGVAGNLQAARISTTHKCGSLHTALTLFNGILPQADNVVRRLDFWLSGPEPH